MISTDNRRLAKTFEEDPKMFVSYANNFNYSLRAKHEISEVINTFTGEDLESTPHSTGNYV